MAGKADSFCPYKWLFCQTKSYTMKLISKAAGIGSRDFKIKFFWKEPSKNFPNGMKSYKLLAES